MCEVPRSMREMCEMPSVKVAKHVRNMCETCEMPSVKVAKRVRNIAKHVRNMRNAQCESCETCAKRARNMCETSRPPRHILAVHRYFYIARNTRVTRAPRAHQTDCQSHWGVEGTDETRTGSHSCAQQPVPCAARPGWAHRNVPYVSRPSIARTVTAARGTGMRVSQTTGRNLTVPAREAVARRTRATNV